MANGKQGAELGSVSALACNFWRPRRKWAGVAIGRRLRVDQRLSCLPTVLGEGAEDYTRGRVWSPSRISAQWMESQNPRARQ